MPSSTVPKMPELVPRRPGTRLPITEKVATAIAEVKTPSEEELERSSALSHFPRLLMVKLDIATEVKVPERKRSNKRLLWDSMNLANSSTLTKSK